MDGNLLAWSLLASGMVDVGLGVFILLHSPRNESKRALGIFILAIASWAIGLFFIFETRTLLSAQFSIIAGMTMCAASLYFALVFPQGAPRRAARGLLLACLGLVGALIYGSPGLFFTSDISISSNAIMVSRGSAYPFFFLLLFAFAGSALGVLVYRWFHASDARLRNQYAYLLSGVGIFLLGAVVSDVALPFFGIYRANGFGPLFSVVMAVVMVYAVVRHELMDIQVIIRRGLLYGLSLGLVGGIYLTLVGAMGFFFGTTTYTLLVSAALTALGVAIAAPLITRARLYKEVRRHAAELERKVEERTKELRESQEKQNQMMLDVSHGLQTPLAVFQTKLEQLKQAAPDDADIRHLEHSLFDLSNFIDNLLKLARLEQNQEKIALAPLCLTSLFTEIVEEIEIIATARSISMRKRVAPNIFVNADAKKIRDVIMNLASNSIKYMRPNGRKEIAFSLVMEGDSIALSVSDTGVGISEEDISHIFERFYRVKDSPARIGGGGLGLAISKYLVEQHGGTLAVESTFGKGTTMTLRLPKVMV